MKPLYTEDEFNNSKSNDLLKCQCYTCNKPFYVLKKTINSALKPNSKDKIFYCSKTCNISQKTKIKVKCKNCNKEFEKLPNQVKITKNNFCCKSCAATYNNKNKTTGTRRSKLEIYLEDKLTQMYPRLEIHFNRKDTINSELDIYIPKFKLAFELNGIFHYEPIYGDKKLDQIQNNDSNKFQKCIEQGISLCIVDTSGQKYFKEQTSVKFLNIINNIIVKNYLNL